MDWRSEKNETWEKPRSHFRYAASPICVCLSIQGCSTLSHKDLSFTLRHQVATTSSHNLTEPTYDADPWWQGAALQTQVKYRGAFCFQEVLGWLAFLSQTRFHYRESYCCSCLGLCYFFTKVFEMPRAIFSIIIFLESTYMVIISRKMVIGQGSHQDK